MRTLSFTFSGLTVKVEQPEDPESLLNQLLKQDSNHPDVVDERIPYWAEVWPSSVGLGSYIAENPHLVRGKKVLEIGCGPGLSGIVAAMTGANVEMTDYMQEAIDLASHNWSLNFTDKAKVSLLDWRSPSLNRADVVLASDVAYESRSFKPLIQALKSLVTKGGIILLSEPNRKLSAAFFQILKTEGFNYTESKKSVLKDGINYSISIYTLVPSA